MSTQPKMIGLNIVAFKSIATELSLFSYLGRQDAVAYKAFITMTHARWAFEQHASNKV